MTDTTADAEGGTEPPVPPIDSDPDAAEPLPEQDPLPPYTLVADDDHRGVETDQLTMLLGQVDENQWEVEAVWGNGLSMTLMGNPNEALNYWTVVEAEVWIDRRAPETFTDYGLPAAKLQEFDAVSDALRALVNEYHTHEGTLAT